MRSVWLGVCALLVVCALIVSATGVQALSANDAGEGVLPNSLGASVSAPVVDPPVAPAGAEAFEFPVEPGPEGTRTPLFSGSVRDTYVPEVPRISVVGGHLEPHRSRDDGGIVYTTISGRYSLETSAPFSLSVEDSRGRPLTDSSFFTIGSPGGPRDALAEPRGGEVLVSSDDHLLVRYELVQEARTVGVMDLDARFFEDRPPKIEVSVAPADPASSFAIYWVVNAPGRSLEAGMYRPVPLDQHASTLVVRGDVTSIRLSAAGGQGTPLVLDWSDVGQGRIWAGPVRASPVLRGNLAIEFPENLARLDPWISGYTSTSQATAYPPQRKLVWIDDAYYAFWWDNGIEYSVLLPSSPWSNERLVPASGEASAGFDVLPLGSSVIVAYTTSDGLALKTRRGFISQGSIDWNWEAPAATVATWTSAMTRPVSLAVSSDGALWVAGAWKDSDDKVKAWVYRSTDGGFTWGSFYHREHIVADTSDPLAVPTLQSASNGTVTLFWVMQSSLALRWRVHDQGGWQIGSQSQNVFGATGPREDAVTYTTTPDDVTHFIYINQGAVYRARIKGATVISSGEFLDSGSSLASPAATHDTNKDLHVFWVASVAGTPTIRYKRQVQSGWAATSSPFGTIPVSPGSLTAIPRALTEVSLLWTAHPISGYRVEFGSLPLPSDIGAGQFDPWARPGLSPYQSYFSQLADFINPSTGLLSVKHDDLSIPGRGVDLNVGRIYAQPSAFVNGAPYIYETFPWADLGPHWSLNLPWVGPTYVHLWNGQAVLIDWDSTGTVFEYHGGEAFRLEKDAQGYMLYAKSGTTMEFDSDGRPEWIRDITNQNFLYFTYYIDGTLLQIQDAPGRAVSFTQTAGRLTSVTSGSRTISFTYWPSSGPLKTVTDPMGRVTTYTYQNIAYATNLLVNVTYPTGGKTIYTYSGIEMWMGTEAKNHPVVRQDVYRGAVLDRYTTFDYESQQGKVVFVVVKQFDGNSVLQGYTEHNFRHQGLYSTVRKFDATGAVFNEVRNWYGQGGFPEQTDTYQRGAAKPSSSTLTLGDNWGNHIWARDAVGHEAFTAFANTDLQNSFYGPGSMSAINDGKLAYENFDNYEISDVISGWTIHAPVGTLTFVIPSEAAYDPVKMSMELMDNSNEEVAWAYKPLGTYVSTAYLDVHVFPLATSPTNFYLGFANASTWRTELILRSGGTWGYTDGTSTFDCDPPGPATTRKWATATWYRVTIEAVLGSNQYNVWVDGQRTCVNIPTLNNWAGLATSVLFWATDSSTIGSLFVDEVKVYKTAGISVFGLRPGMVAELLDVNGATASKVMATAVAPTPYLTSIPFDQDTQEYRAYEIGPALVRIYSENRQLEYVSPYREVFGGTSYLYSWSSKVASISKTRDGFGRWLTSPPVWVDDAWPAGSILSGETHWWRYAGEAPVSGSQWHHGKYTPGIHSHEFAATTDTRTVGSGQFIVQYMWIPPDNFPAELMLQFRETSGSWGHRAYWGADLIPYGTPNTNSRRPMGPIPFLPGRWIQFIVRADDVGLAPATIDGVGYTLYGGNASFDVTTLGDADTGRIGVSGLLPGQKVDLLDATGAYRTGAVVGGGQTTAWIDPYAVMVRAFPFRGSLRVTGTDGVTVHYVSPTMEFFGGDMYAYTPPEFFVQGVPSNVRNLAAGTLGYQTHGRGAQTVYYNFSATNPNGLMQDLSFTGQHGTITGTTVTGGVIGNARRFDGVGDGVSIPDNPQLDTNYQMTISLWLRPETYVEPGTSNPGIFVSKWNSAGQNPAGQFIFWFKDSSGKLRFTTGKYGDTISYSFDGSAVIALNNWTHVAAVYQRGAVSLYVNGALDAAGTVTPLVLTTSEYPNDDLWVGRLWNSAYEFTGSMDELMILPRALSADDIALMYRSQLWAGNAGRQVSYTLYGTTGGKVGKPVEIKNFHDGYWLRSLSDYDAYGNLITATDARQNVVSYEYSPTYGSAYMTRITEPLGVTSNFSYDFATGMRTYEVDPNGGVTNHSYDKLLRILRTTYPMVDGSRNFIQYTYDDAGNTLTIADELGKRIRHSYDAIGREKKVERLWSNGTAYSTELFAYDWMDRVISQTTAENLVYQTQYDFLSRLTRATNPDSTFRTVEYDDVNNVVNATDEVGRKVQFTYDWANRLKKAGEFNPQTGFYSNSTQIKYDGRGAVVVVTDLTALATTHVYDDLARLDRTVYPDSAETYERFTYDGVDNLVSKRKRDGVVISYIYNALNRLTTITYPGGYTVSYAYDKIGNTKRVENSNATLWYEYDARSRMTKDSTFVSPRNFTIEYTYDAASNLATMKYPDALGSVFTYVPDAFNRVDTVQDARGTSATFGYRRDDRISSVSFGNSVVTAFTYDGRARPDVLATTRLGSPRLTLDYGYNAAGDVTSLGITTPTASLTEVMGYDGQDRIVSWTASGTFTGSQQFSYAGTWGASGDRTSFAEGGVTWSYVYSQDHRLSSYSKPGVAWSFGYDANGNAVWRNQTLGGTTAWLYLRDAEDRITEVKLNGATVGTYVYDGLGRRVNTVEGPDQTHFVYSGLSLVYTERVDSQQLVSMTDYVYASGLLVAWIADTVPKYVHQDTLGSVRMTTDTAGAISHSTQYTPFGTPYGTIVEPVYQRLKFTGQWNDATTGLYYLFRRFYDPEIGRFLSQDPVLGHLAAPQTLNPYVYTANNPIRHVDPTGEFFWNPFDAVAAAVGAVQSAITSAANAVANWWASSSWLDKLDMAMTIIGFIPGIDVISDVYFLGRAIIDVATGKGDWTDVALAAVGLALPVGGAALKMLKKAANAADSLGDLGKAGTRAAKNADAGKGAAKLDDIGCHSPCPIDGKGSRGSLMKPGKHAGESIPARSSARDFTAAERAEINRIGQTTGCHTCGAVDPGTKHGDFVLDHIPPTRLNSRGAPQRLFPQCIHCMRVQGGEITALLARGG